MSQRISRRWLSWIGGVLICGAMTAGLSGWNVAGAEEELVRQLTLDEAIQTALSDNLQLKAARAQLQVGRAQIVTAGARLNPSLLSDNGIAEKTYRLGIEQTFELGGKRRRRVALAQAQLGVSETTFNTRLLDLRTEVRRAYTQLYNAQERQKSYDNILQVSQELVDLSRKREKAGDISKLDVLQSEIASINANNDLQSAVIDVVTSRNQLNVLLNQPLDTLWSLSPPDVAPRLEQIFLADEPHLTVSPQAPGMQTPGKASGLVSGGSPGETEDPALEKLMEMASRKRPELENNRRDVETTRLQTALARANRIPNLSLTAGPDLVSGPAPDGAFSAFIIGTMELPLFNRQQGPMLEAEARRSQLEQEQAALKMRVRLEVANAYSMFRANQARIKRYEKELLPYSVALVDKSRQAFREGKTSILTPLIAQQSYMKTRIGYLQALTEYQNSIADLERAVGAGL